MARSSSLVKASLPKQRRQLRPRRSPKQFQRAAALSLPGAEDIFVAAAAEHLQQGAPAPGYTASDETLVVHAGEKLRKNGMADTDSIATPIVSGTTHWFKNSADLIAFKEGRRHSFEYGRYGNPTVSVLEEKISALERAEATLVTSSGMNAIVATLLALVPPGGHVVTTTDCYSEARAFIRERLSKMGIRVRLSRSSRACLLARSILILYLVCVVLQSTFVDLNDIETLKAVLDQGDVCCLTEIMII
jgi:cystathionine gamma-synthase